MVKASARLTTAIAQGGDLPPLVAALTTHEAKRRDVEARLAALRTPQPTLDAPAVRRQLAGYLADWRGLLRGNVAQSQAILRRLIKGRLTFTPDQAGNYTFAGVGTVRPLLAGAIRNVASPNGLAPFSAPIARGRRQYMGPSAAPPDLACWCRSLAVRRATGAPPEMDCACAHADGARGVVPPVGAQQTGN